MKNKKKYKHKFKEIIIRNRWMRPFYSRNGDWVILGLGKNYFSPIEYEYYIALFGIDIRFIFERIIIK